MRRGTVARGELARLIGRLVVPGLVSGALAVAGTGCGGDEGICSGDALVTALARANAGDTVTVGACAVEGTFVVPAGVVLRGLAPQRTRIVAAEGDTPGLRLQLAAGATTSVQDLMIDSAAQTAVYATGEGAVTIEDVSITSSRGVALRLEGAEASTVRRTTLRGPINAENANSVPVSPGPTTTATHGILAPTNASTNATIELEDVDVSGFARFGALIVERNVRWTRGHLGETLGTGAMFVSCDASLNSVDVTTIFQGVQPAPAYGIVTTRSAAAAGAVDPVLRSRDLHVDGSQGVGVLQDRGTAEHTNLVLARNELGGIWAQNATMFRIAGTASRAEDNGLAAVVSVANEMTDVEGLRVTGTRLKPSIFGETSARSIGDGIELVDATAANLRSVALSGNARVGLLYSFADRARRGTLTLDGVTVDASEGAYGAVAQDSGGVLHDGWDTGLARTGAAATNDLTAPTVDPLGIIAPMFLPRL